MTKAVNQFEQFELCGKIMQVICTN